MEERVITEARRAVEAVVMAAIEPVEAQVLAQLVEIPVTEVEALCTDLAEEYEREGRGFALVRVAGGYRFQTHPDMAPYVERFVLEGQTARLSAPALETLAIVAYKQPVSRAQLAAIRGVSVESTLSTLSAAERGDPVRHDAALPRTARPRLAARSPAARGVRPRAFGGGGPRTWLAPSYRRRLGAFDRRERC